VIVVFLFFFGSHNFRAHLLMIGAVAGVLSFSLVLTLMLAYPFSGQLSVSSDPFRLGILGQLNPHTGLPSGHTCLNCNSGP
jgi:hypothetical protein